MSDKKCKIIGIAGGTGSGKSTFTNRIKAEFGNDVSVLYYDNYYKAQDNVSFEERKLINYDHPDSLETDLLIQHIKDLKSGKTILSPVYDYRIHNRSKKSVVVKPTPVIVIEGILTLQNDELRELIDIKVFVDTDADERILRRTIRDIKERGRDVDSVAKQYLTTVKKMHYLYVEPTKQYADIVINGGLNDIAFDLLKLKIKDLLNQTNKNH